MNGYKLQQREDTLEAKDMRLLVPGAHPEPIEADGQKILTIHSTDMRSLPMSLSHGRRDGGATTA